MKSEKNQIRDDSAVLFIEFQNEWLSENGRLRRNLITDEERFKKSIINAKKLLNLSRENNAHIFHVTLQPDTGYKIFGDAEFGLRSAIPNANTWRGDMKDIHADFAPAANEVVIRDRTGASAFSGSMLDSVLRNNKINTLYIAGFATHVCVESTLREGHDKGYTCYVVTDATAAFTAEQQEYFEKEILHHFGKGLSVSMFFGIDA